MIDFQVACDKLAQFANAEEIANFLRSQKVQGYVNLTNKCVIARWISAETGDLVFVSRLKCWTMDESLNGYRFHTPAMKDFIQKFDMGYYMDLVHPSDPIWDYQGNFPWKQEFEPVGSG